MRSVAMRRACLATTIVMRPADHATGRARLDHVTRGEETVVLGICGRPAFGGQLLTRLQIVGQIVGVGYRVRQLVIERLGELLEAATVVLGNDINGQTFGRQPLQLPRLLGLDGSVVRLDY